MAVSKRWNLSIPRPKGSGQGRYWQNVGILMEMDDGRMSIKLNALPVGPVAGRDDAPVAWDGWISVFPANEQDRPLQTGGTQQTRSAARRMGGDVDDDEIPF